MVLALVLLAGAAGLPSTPASAAQPQVRVDPATAAVGDRLTVTLTGWPAGNIQLDVCGNQADRGSLDCATLAAHHRHLAGPDPVTTSITVVAPPVACPCVVRARSLDPAATGAATGAVTGDPVTGVASLGIVGLVVPAAPVDPDPGQLRITGLTVRPAGWDWPALFALPSRLLVEVDLHNDGPATAVDPRLAVLVGRPGQATLIVEPPQVPVLAAGERRAVRIAVPVDAPVYGRYAVHGQLDWAVGPGGHAGIPYAGTPVVFVAETERYPWGWAALAGVLLLILLARQVVGLVRDRRQPFLS
ncbi:hypothetical protein O7632_07975 [Solwaraspora sp. WMMD406]|uniref:hypothetical protein n=1 Tax=Solwaraspora sp. WMMD406 TaxID=3016095 RepID=UPI002415BB7F|nr:hypothetical protein [Solwaraspora sp. WMMD406]MDG4764042.1 hypothetical protein [Solwaraspora sp. WMMD406]